MSAWAKPGVKCVFVYEGAEGTGTIINDRGFRARPKYLEICTIRWVERVEPHGLFLVLEGFPDLQLFHVRGFRPLTNPSQEQDIEIFLPLLDLKELVE